MTSRSFSLQLLLAYSLAQCLLLCSAAPSTSDCTTADEVVNTFDLGPIDGCVVPQTNFCQNVDYLVPTSIANLSAIFEKEIEAEYLKYSDQISQACADAFREISCAMRFPRCSEDLQTVALGRDVIGNCTTNISVCFTTDNNKAKFEGLCDLEGTYPLAGSDDSDACSPVTQYSGHEFQYCSLNSETYVTEWMYQLLAHADKQVSIFAGTLESQSYSACVPNFVKYYCQRVGRCWTAPDNSTRVESINSLGSCDQAFNCFPDWLADFHRERHDCMLWPKEVPVILSPCVTTEAPTTDATTQTTTTSTTHVMTWPTTSTPFFVPENGSAKSIQYSFIVLFVVILTLLVIVL